MLLLGLAWDGAVARPVLLENLDYTMGMGGDVQSIKASFEPLKDTSPRVVLRYRYTGRVSDRPLASASWTETFEWDGGRLVLKTHGTTRSRHKAVLFVREALGQLRATISRLELSPLCADPEELFRVTGAMQIMPPWPLLLGPANDRDR
jgi:hypothetical protein